MRLAQYKLPVKTKFISIEKDKADSEKERTNDKKSKEEVKK